MFGNAIELGQPSLGVTPEALDAVNVRSIVGEFIPSVLDSQVLFVTDIDQAVVPSPAVGMHHRVEADAAANGFLQGLFATIRDDLGVDLSVSFEDAKDNGLACSPPAAFTPNTFGSEVGFVDFDLPGKRRLSFAMLSDAATQFQVNTVDRAKADAGQLGGIGRGEVHRKCVNDASKNLLADSGTDVITVTLGGHRS